MPGLIRAAARTAVIAGTATSVSNRVSRRQSNRWAQQEYENQQRYAQPQPTQQYVAPAPAPAAAPAAPSGDTIEQLKELGALYQQGILTEQEFAVQKAKILGS
ncbi:SHOCT domain-containing protein [Gordonia sp. SID5947]|uniref:SHOCT domain-containing protein n=1 Tax=Gordonia sp. SID5947 TaxID=2690315 RepID=UPI00136F0D6F|nr:SHOCT domain-containing protein [Gordonia sp. SID5947]MYR05284.1 SHOCT domain-containing protein [Gordonia sp. SID5947]